MPLATAAKNLMLNALAGVNPALSATHMSLHTGDPGATGANEVTGGSPAYQRRAITWNTASSGNLDDASVPAFDIPPSTTLSHFGLWSASSGGTFLGGDALSTTETYGAQGTFTVSDLDVSL